MAGSEVDTEECKDDETKTATYCKSVVKCLLSLGHR